MLGIALGAAGLVLAGTAICLTVIVERLKRPRLRISPAKWVPDEPVPWTFAVVHVFNDEQMPRLFRFLARNSAESCTATIEFRRANQNELAFPPVAGRWSGRPEPGTPVAVTAPIEVVPVSPSTGGSPTIINVGVSSFDVYDRARAIESRRFDIPAGEDGEEVACAVLTRKGKAYAWGSESQKFNDWENPTWALGPGESYDVTVRIRGSSVEALILCRLDVPELEETDPRFELSPIS